MEFKAIRLSQSDIDNIWSKTDEISDGWKFKLVLGTDQKQVFESVRNRATFKRLLDMQQYMETPSFGGSRLFVCVGRLRQIPRPFFPRALFDTIVEEMPRTFWHIQVWNASEREWHHFKCDYQTSKDSYNLYWETVRLNSGCQFSCTRLEDTLWLHAVEFETNKSITVLLQDFKLEAELRNGDRISRGVVASIGSGNKLSCISIANDATLYVNSGASLVDVSVDRGGKCIVENGGTVFKGLIEGLLLVRGKAENVNIEGFAQVSSGGTMLCGICKNSLHVNSGGACKFTRVASGGIIEAHSSSFLYQVSAGSNGMVSVDDGAYAPNLIIESGGTACIASGATIENLNKREGGRLKECICI